MFLILTRFRKIVNDRKSKFIIHVPISFMYRFMPVIYITITERFLSQSKIVQWTELPTINNRHIILPTFPPTTPRVTRAPNERATPSRCLSPAAGKRRTHDREMREGDRRAVIALNFRGHARSLITVIHSGADGECRQKTAHARACTISILCCIIMM